MDEIEALEEDLVAKDLHVQATYLLTEALAASEKKMRRRIELLSEVVFETDVAGRLIFFNQALTQSLGYEQHSMLGFPLREFVVAVDRPQLDEIVERALHGRSSPAPPIRFVARDGSIVWMEVSAAKLDEGGIVGALHNVTRQKLAQDELAKLSLVASFTDNLVIMTDREGRIEWVNQAFTKKTGYSNQEVAGLKPGPLLQGPGTDPATVARISQLLRGGLSFEFEILNYTRFGQPYWSRIHITPIRNAQGVVERFISVQADSTELRHTQEQLEAAKEAAELASHKAMEANRLKSEFLANMSHEIRTPMNGIIGMTQLALDTPLNDEQREFLEDALISAEALLRVINDILDFSKVEAGKLELDPQPFGIRSELGKVLPGLALRARQKNLDFRWEIAANVPEQLIADSTRLRQIVINLVDNAIKFTPSGEVVVRVSSESLKPGSVMLHVCVCDTGLGIPSAKQACIFDAFTQADGSTTRLYGGTGLGLAICAKLVELLDGRIWVESEPGQGSAFHFTARCLVGVKEK